MKITYDPQADAATIYLVADIPPGGTPRSLVTDFEMREGAVVLLLSDDDHLLGIEVLGASKILPRSVLQGGPTDSPDR